MRRAVRHFHDPCRAQNLLNVHRRVAQAVAIRSSDGEGVDITVLRRQSTTMPTELTDEHVRDLLRDGGFEGKLRSITFAASAAAMPPCPHRRVLLLDIVRMLFRSADADADGLVCKEELQAWIVKHGLAHNSGLVDAVGEANSDRMLALDDFKALLTRSGLVTFQREQGTDGYGVHPLLYDAACGVFFEHADLDSDGAVSLEELVRMFEVHELGDAARAEHHFERFAGGQGVLQKEDFMRLLLGLKVVHDPQPRAVCAIL